MRAATIVITLIFTGLLLFTGCGTEKKQSKTVSQTPILDQDAAQKQLESLPDSTIQHVNRFAYTTFKQLCLDHPEENAVFSPSGLYTALTMAYYGSGFDTKQQFEKTMLLDTTLSSDSFNVHARELTRYLFAREDLISMENTMKVGERIMIMRAFEDLMERVYDVRISKYPDESLVLQNNLMFKGFWQETFDKSKTVEGEFHISPDSTISIPMMHRLLSDETPVYYHETEIFQSVMLEFNFNGNFGASMIIILPNEGQHPDSLLKFDLGEVFSLAYFQPAVGELILPRMTFAEKQVLNSTLASCGLERPFTVLAEFPHITDMDLMISEVRQAIELTINEEGVEAEATTEVEMKAASEKRQAMPAINFDVNRPFLFAIVDQPTEMILFMGKVYNPVVNESAE